MSTQNCPLPRLERVLLATDGSLYSEGAVREAINIAKQCSSRLYALSVVEAVTDYEVFPLKVEDALLASAKEHLAAVKKGAEDAGVLCETLIIYGESPHKSIIETAETKKVDMIIVGRRGRTGIKKLLMGEVAAKVIGDAPCKVLVVPRAAHVGFKSILVALDGSKHSDTGLGEAVSIAKRMGSTILALSSARDESGLAEAQSIVEKAVELAKKEGIEAVGVAPTGEPDRSIVEEAGCRAVDLIVMGAYGRTGLKKALMGSATEKVIGHAACAVMVAKAT